MFFRDRWRRIGGRRRNEGMMLDVEDFGARKMSKGTNK